MAAQATVEGRFLGGRPPYGYTLVDLGPHPNPAKAADGRRLRGLALCEQTAPVVVRIFAEFVGGKGLFAIAEGLTRDKIPCPSAHDPARNPHRNGNAWSKGAIRAIVTNPRYTGRQVWNKQRKDEVLLDVDDVGLGHATKLRWNTTDKWIWSDDVVHPAIVDPELFTQAQQLLAGRGRGPGDHKTPRTRRPYVLRGAFHCGLCDRKMQGHWTHDAAYYRCRYPQEYALANHVHHPTNVYVREDAVLPALDAWLARALRPPRLTDTLDAMTATQAGPTTDDLAAERARRTVAEATTKLARHRAALEAGADPAIVTSWIAQTQAERVAAERQLREIVGHTDGRMSREEIATMVQALGDIAAALADADPADKAEVYRQLGLRLTYRPATNTVEAHVKIDPRYRGVMVGVRGGT